MEGEGPPGFVLGPIELTGSFTRQLGVIKKIHDGTEQGMDYSWVPGAVFWWSWMQMLNMLPPDRFAQNVGANHICRITLEHVPGSTDHKRCYAPTQCNTQVPFPPEASVHVWDFHVLTSDVWCTGSTRITIIGRPRREKSWALRPICRSRQTQAVDGATGLAQTVR